MPLAGIDLVQKIYIDTTLGWVELNGVQFDAVHMPCFGCPDISWAIEGPAVRGEDRLLPGVAGVVPYPRRPTVTKRSVPVIVIGKVDHNGAVNADYGIGLRNNLDYLQNQVALPPGGTGPFTYTATLHHPDGTTKTAQFVTEHMAVTLQPGAQAKVVLDLSFPYGYFQ